jgi:hypothetical protein
MTGPLKSICTSFNHSSSLSKGPPEGVGGSRGRSIAEKQYGDQKSCMFRRTNRENPREELPNFGISHRHASGMMGFVIT